MEAVIYVGYLVCIPVVVVSTLLATTSFVVILLILTRKSRDIILSVSVLLADVLFVISSLIFLAGWKNETVSKSTDELLRVSSIFVVTFLLLSCVAQFMMSLNRHIVVTFPFRYKTVLSGRKLVVSTSLVWSIALIIVIVYLVATKNYEISSIDSNDVLKSRDQLTVLIGLFRHVTHPPLLFVTSLLTILLLSTVVLEIRLWRTANGHQKRYKTVIRSVIRNTEDRETSRRCSETMKTLKPKRTPSLLLTAHVCCLLPLLVLAVIETLKPRLMALEPLIWTSVISQVLIFARPILNCFHHTSRKKFHSAKKRIRKLLGCQSKYKSSFYSQDDLAEIRQFHRLHVGLRRESANSNVTDVSVL